MACPGDRSRSIAPCALGRLRASRLVPKPSARPHLDRHRPTAGVESPTPRTSARAPERSAALSLAASPTAIDSSASYIPGWPVLRCTPEQVGEYGATSASLDQPRS